MKYNTKIYGHRGASQYAPENTMEAFQIAYEMGADGIEFDVQMTKDRYLVVAHDEDISRVSNGNGLIKDFTLDELRRFSFNKTHPEYKHSRIPLLEEVLDCFSKTDFLFNIELKNGMFPYEGMEEKIINVVKEKDVMEKTIFSSFYHFSMMNLHNYEPNVKTALLFHDQIIDVTKYMKEYNIDIIHPAWHHLNRKEILEEFHEKGITVNVWTVNSGKEIRRLCDMGVDGIITNRPDLGSEIRDDAV